MFLVSELPIFQNLASKIKGGAGQRGYMFWSRTLDFRCPTTYERSGDSVCAQKCPETIPYHAYTYYGTSVKILK